MMKALQQQLYWWHERLGRAGTASIALLLCAITAYAMAIIPARDELTQLEQTITQEEQSARVSVQRAKATEESESSRESHLYSDFPQRREVARLLKQLYATAERAHLTLQRGEYKLTREGKGPFMRYEIELPLQGRYTEIQSFAHGALKELPTLALDEIRFKRESARSPLVQAKLHFSLYLLERK